LTTCCASILLAISLQTFSIGFKSAPFGGHGKSSNYFPSSQSITMLLIWIEDLSCTKGTGSSAVEPNRAQAEGTRWSSRTLIYFSTMRRPLILWIAPAPSKEKHPIEVSTSGHSAWWKINVLEQIGFRLFE
jgi:hypothetical protein